MKFHETNKIFDLNYFSGGWVDLRLTSALVLVKVELTLKKHLKLTQIENLNNSKWVGGWPY